MSHAQDYDSDFSHAMLVAVLVKLGGSIELDLADLAPDAMGNPAGELYNVAMDPVGGTRIQLSVHARPTGETSGNG